MNSPTGGRSAAELCEAQRLHEALIIALTPGENASSAQVLTAHNMAKHAPEWGTHYEPCAGHADNLIMISIPGFHCDTCRVVFDIQCRECVAAWPCADVRVASNACALDAPGAVDEFLAKLAAAS